METLRGRKSGYRGFAPLCLTRAEGRPESAEQENRTSQGWQESGDAKYGRYERMSESVTVSEKAKQTESAPSQWAWVDRAIWTERMLAALGNGVKGNKWFSLIDKVYRPSTLQAAWQQVKANKGAAGIDRQSVEGFAANELVYLGDKLCRSD